MKFSLTMTKNIQVVGSLAGVIMLLPGLALAYGGGGGNGPIVGTYGPITAPSAPSNTPPAPQVLGASTSTTPTSCVALLTTYMRRGANNDPEEVKKLQQFLNDEMGSGLPITGYFGPLTEAAVKAFQQKYAADVLTPWGLTEPTGRVYKTTRREINLIHCSSLNIPMPTDLTPYQGE